MATPIKQIEVGGTNYNIRGYFYGTCGTAAGTATKVVTCAEFTTYTDMTGAAIFITFTYANTAGTPKLNITSLGAKNIFYNGAQITTGDEKSLLKGTCLFIYDGTQWHLIPSSAGPSSTVPSHTHSITTSTVATTTPSTANTGSTSITPAGVVTGSLSGTILTLGFSGTSDSHTHNLNSHTHNYVKATGTGTPQ